MSSLTPVTSVINFVYFSLNFTNGFVFKVWKDDPHLAEHLQNVFYESYKKHGTMCMINFFSQLDDINQKIFVNWINENYLAFPHLKQ